MIERAYYGLSDLASRWGCKVDDLIHLGAHGRAQICVNVYARVAGVRKEAMVDISFDKVPPDGVSPGPDAMEASIDGDDPGLSAPAPEMPVAIYEVDPEELRILEQPRAFPHFLAEAVQFDRGRWWACTFDPPLEIWIEDLCMLHAEVERLDQEITGKTKSPERQPGGGDRKTLLRIIGGMAAAGYGIDPRASRISRLGEILADLERLGIEVSDETLRTKLREAFALISPASTK